MKPLGLTAYRLSNDIGVPVTPGYDIVVGKRAITAETDLLLCGCFGSSNGWWLALQSHHDTQFARRALGKRLEKSCVVRCSI